MPASVTFKQYKYTYIYKGETHSGTLAASGDHDAVEEVRNSVGYQHFAFSSGISVMDNSGKVIYSRGMTVKPRGKTWPIYTVQEW